MSDEFQAPLSVYRAAVRRLTAENRSLREQLAEERAERAADVRRLAAQVNEGLSPELTVLRRQLGQWRTRAQAAELRLRELRRRAG